jgi:hypothetical protein
LTPGEHAVIAEWLAAAGDVALAYVSDRRTDDPAFYNCVVIITRPDDGPSHLVHAPSGQDVWIVFTLKPKSNLQTFSTLREALNAIQPVLMEVDPVHIPLVPRC